MPLSIKRRPSADSVAGGSNSVVRKISYLHCRRQKLDEGENITKRRKMWRCDPCCLKFNDIIPYFHHVTSRRHQEQNLCAPSQPCGNRFLGEDEGMWIPEDGPMYCSMCDVSANGVESFVYHLEGTRHKKELQRSPEIGFSDESLEENEKIILRLKAVLVNRKKYGYSCKRCNMKFTGRWPFKMHIRGRKHAKMVFKSWCGQKLNGYLA